MKRSRRPRLQNWSQNMQLKLMDFAVQEACKECCKQPKARKPICRAPLAFPEEGEQSKHVARINNDKYASIVSSSTAALACICQNKPDRTHSKPTQTNSAHDTTLFLDLWSRLYLLVDHWRPYHMPRTSKNPRPAEVKASSKKIGKNHGCNPRKNEIDCEMCPVVNELQQKRLNTSDLWKSNSKSLWDGSFIVLPQINDAFALPYPIKRPPSQHEPSRLTEATWSKSRKLQRSHGANFMERFAQLVVFDPVSLIKDVWSWKKLRQSSKCWVCDQSV